MRSWVAVSKTMYEKILLKKHEDDGVGWLDWPASRPRNIAVVNEYLTGFSPQYSSGGASGCCDDLATTPDDLYTLVRPICRPASWGMFLYQLYAQSILMNLVTTVREQ
jgi:hypothetical protein